MNRFKALTLQEKKKLFREKNYRRWWEEDEERIREPSKGHSVDEPKVLRKARNPFEAAKNPFDPLRRDGSQEREKKPRINGDVEDEIDKKKEEEMERRFQEKKKET